jgi:hypothetical protein
VQTKVPGLGTVTPAGLTRSAAVPPSRLQLYTESAPGVPPLLVVNVATGRTVLS